MLQTRRVFDLTNTIVNYLFMIFIFLCGVYFISFWLELKSAFLYTMVNILNVLAWVVTIISVLMAVLALWISFSDRSFQVGKLVWCVCRMAICILLAVFIDICSILVSGEIGVNL